MILNLISVASSYLILRFGWFMAEYSTGLNVTQVWFGGWRGEVDARNSLKLQSTNDKYERDWQLGSRGHQMVTIYLPPSSHTLPPVRRWRPLEVNSRRFERVWVIVKLTLHCILPVHASLPYRYIGYWSVRFDILQAVTAGRVTLNDVDALTLNDIYRQVFYFLKNRNDSST